MVQISDWLSDKNLGGEGGVGFQSCVFVFEMGIGLSISSPCDAA